MAEKRHVVVVCGYGCHLFYPKGSGKSLDGNPTPLVDYLDRVAVFVDKKLPDLVVFCGGETQHESAPGVSEAGLMLGYVIDQLRGLVVNFMKEEGSYTTHDNIKLAAAIIYKNLKRLGEINRITIFCEAQRSLKVSLLARHFMRSLVADPEGDIRTETVSWERANPGRELWTTFLTWLAIKFPWLRLAEMEHKRKMRKSLHR